MEMRRWARTSAVAAIAGLVLAGCGSASTADGTEGAPSVTPDGGGTVQVVASTNVWGDIVAAIGGDRVDVTSIVDDTAADPHSFEVGAQDQLAVSKAQLIVMNGGHYDDYMSDLIAAAASSATVVDAVDASGIEDAGHDHADETVAGSASADDHSEESHADESHADETHADETHADETVAGTGEEIAGEEAAGEEATEEDGHAGHNHGELNEHLWFDLHSVAHVAEAIEHELSELDPAGAETFAANLETFLGGIEGLEAQAAELATTAAGKGVAVTEPLPLYLLEEIGMENRTPAEFSNAIEGDTDVPAAVLAETLALFTDHQVDLLVYNEQTTSPQTEQVKTEAEEAGIPVVGVAETLPEGQTYLTWMATSLDSLAAALSA